MNTTTMTQQERAVIIAQDALKWIESKKLKVVTGTYFRVPIGLEDRTNESFQDFLKEVTPEKPCRVCALGGLFVASVDRFNEAKIIPDSWGCSEQEFTYHIDSLMTHMEDAFGLQQMRLIESVFEGRDMDMEHWDGESRGALAFPEQFPCDCGEKDCYADDIAPEIRDAIAFGEQFLDATERLNQICLNIIKNKGLFIP